MKNIKNKKLLLPSYYDNKELYNAMDRLAYAFTGELNIPEIKDKTTKKDINGRKTWTYIPNFGYVQSLISVKEYFREKGKERPWFLDVGCGCGNVTAVATAIGFATEGIEYNDKLPNIFRSRRHILDAFDFKEYGEFDVIYMYMPLVFTKDMSELLSIIDAQLKKGTIIIMKLANADPTKKTIDYSIMDKFTRGMQIPDRWFMFSNSECVYLVS